MRRQFVVLAMVLVSIAGCGAAGIGDAYFPTYGNGGWGRISGRQLDGLFQTWLFSPERPTVPAAAQGPAASQTTEDARAREWRAGLALRLAHGAR